MGDTLDLPQVDLTSLASGARPSDEVASYAGIVYFRLIQLRLQNFNTCVRVRIPFPSPATASSFASIFPAIHGPSKLCAAVAHYAFIMATI